MARIVKDAEVRREELLETALRLFLANGYDRTSVEQITESVGVAKGTFYHYFESKSDLLEQLATDWGEQIFQALETGLSGVEGDAVARLRAVYEIGGQVKLDRRAETLGLTRSLYSEENLLLRYRLFEKWIDRTRPILVGIMEQGIVEGVFDVPDARAATEVWLSLWYDFGGRISSLFVDVMDASTPELTERLIADLEALENAQERILGLPAGSLDLDVRRKVSAALAGNE